MVCVWLTNSWTNFSNWVKASYTRARWRRNLNIGAARSSRSCTSAIRVKHFAVRATQYSRPSSFSPMSPFWKPRFLSNSQMLKYYRFRRAMVARSPVISCKSMYLCSRKRPSKNSRSSSETLWLDLNSSFTSRVMFCKKPTILIMFSCTRNPIVIICRLC
jgi:hypothetical protein